MAREQMEYDVVIIGAGPAGLAAAIRYAQLCNENNQNLSICILEKASEVGAHILSGAVLDPRALLELIPDAVEKGAPLYTKAIEDKFLYLTKTKSYQLPTPRPMKNHGNYIISLSNLCRWLGQYAESLGVEIYPGFAAQELIFENNNKNINSKIIGVRTGDMGIDKQKTKKSSYQQGMDILGKHCVFAEGCRGHLTQELIKIFNLNHNKQPQTYGIGIKELWEIDEKYHKPGTVVHTIGWPLNQKTYGGSFLYHFEQNNKKLLSIGLVVGLDYQNPYLSPYQEFQRFKHHPEIIKILNSDGNSNNSRCLNYGARALNEGGFQSIPNLSFNGGLIIGCAAGFLDVPKIKGSHNAMKSGMLAAESLFEQSDYKTNYQNKINSSWIYRELKQVRNIRPSFRWGLWAGLAYSALDTYLWTHKLPFTLKHHADHTKIKPAAKFKKISYPKPDGVVSFDKMTSVNRANVYHEEDQPCHLRIKNQNIPTQINYQIYAGLESNYCPAGVYEYIIDEHQKPKLQINAQNCVHCKTCDIKDPKQNIQWVPPEGGGGPNYSDM